MRNPLVLGALAAMAATAGTALPAASQSAQSWEIGPIIRGRNYSVGMPLRPAPAGKGWRFDFPSPHRGAGHVHYVTFRPGSLAGKTRIVARYRVEAAPGVRFVPQQWPNETPTVSLYFQRSGDNWTAKRRYEHYRWYAPMATVRAIAPGVVEMSVDLRDPDWGSVQGKRAGDYPRPFHEALAETDRVGLVFGSHGGRGHGVFATGPARFTLLSFRIL